MRYLLIVALLSSLMLAGCGSGPARLASPAPPTATPLPPTPSAPTPTPFPNAIPNDQLNASVFHFYEGNPVIQHGVHPKWDNIYIDPGAMVYHDGQFHMFFDGIVGFPAPVNIGYATSPDGFHWTRQGTEPVLTARALKGTNLSGENLFATSALVKDDGTWVLYFYTLSGGTFNGPGEIGRATAPDPNGPWTIDPNPVLTPGPSGAWDEVQVNAADVHQTSDGYVMYYDGHGSDSTSEIGMATSSDGIHWTKYNDPSTDDPAFTESDPVLTVSQDGWDSKRVIDPNVIQTSDGWEMIYLSTNGTGKFGGNEVAFGAASSSDGIHWTKSSQNPVLSNRDHPQWAHAYLATLLHVADTYFLYFDFVTPTLVGTNVYLATYSGSLK